MLEQPIARLLDRAAPSWRPVVERWRDSDAGRRLIAFLDQRQAAGATIYPADPLRALAWTPLDQVRVVILGQDPYHGAGQAEGLAFSVAGTSVPPSLRNIFLELRRDLGRPSRVNGHLGPWARQGVLLLNTVLTVEEGQPGVHAEQGWEALTDEIIKATVGSEGDKVYLLWGAAAQTKAAIVAAEPRHLVLSANHPSPLSARRPPRPFIGCGHFSAANRFLVARGGPEITWAPDAPGLGTP